MSLLTKLVKKFLSKKCSTLAMDENGDFPLDCFLLQSIGGLGINYVLNFELVDLIIDDMEELAASGNVGKIDTTKSFPNTINTIIKQFNLMYIDKYSTILRRVIKLMRHIFNLEEFVDFSKPNGA